MLIYFIFQMEIISNRFYYSLQMILDRVNTSRQPFDLVVQPGIVDLKSYRIKGQGRFPPLLSLLIVGSSIGLFAYVNTFFLIKMGDVINGSVYNKTTEVFSCDFYFCDQTAFNFINYYSNYVKCNQKNCVNIVCNGYNCSEIYNYDINQYYACQPGCGSIQSLPPPPIVTKAYVISLVAACLFGIGMIIPIFYGIFSVLCTQQLSTLQKAGLLLNFTWPKLKYWAFRKRIYWDAFYFDLRCMVFIDLFVNLFYAMTLALYIYLEINQLWQTKLQIACFYMLILASLTRLSIMGQITGPFMSTNKQLNSLRMAKNR